MRILLLAHSFNSLTQRLFGVLRTLGHTVSVELDIADAVAQDAPGGSTIGRAVAAHLLMKMP